MTESIEKQALSFLGLCVRAGRVSSGQEACVGEVRNGSVALALLDAGASPNTRKRMLDVCHSHETPLYEVSEGSLGHAIGKQGRMTVTLGADGMTAKLLTILKDQPRL